MGVFVRLLFKELEKPFSWSECGKTFKQKLLLQNHMLVHTGLRPPCRCPVCDNILKSEYELPQPLKFAYFLCPVCDKHFLNKMELDSQQIPAWAGYIPKTGSPPTKLTTVDYYPFNNYPITEYKTVQECLRAAEEALHEVGQDYMITT